MDRRACVLSSPGIERAISRLLGVDGMGPGGVAVPDLLLERLGHRAALGAARALGGLVAVTGRTPDDVASAVADGSLDIACADDVPDETARGVLARTVARVLLRFDACCDARRRLFGGAPADIAATTRAIVRGEYFREDRSAALAAVEAGTVIVAYAAGSHDVHLGASPYGTVHEHVRRLRESLDAVAERSGTYAMLAIEARGACAPEMAVLAALERVDVLAGIVGGGVDENYARLIARRAGVLVDARREGPVASTRDRPDGAFPTAAGYWDPFAEAFEREPEAPRG